MDRPGFGEAQQAAEYISGRAGLRPQIALVLGSGLGPLAQKVEAPDPIPYRDIPHFPVSTAPGHAGRLVLGRLAGHDVAVMVGRAHLYEGYSPAQVVFPIRVLRLIGAQILIITNAAGGVNPEFHAGTLMLITDHINFTGSNPLTGPNEEGFGPRFPDMSEVYDSALRTLALQVALDRRITLAQGVYLALAGPSYETPAEIRMARTLGADAVGMSTVMEAIAAYHAGSRILGLSCITNMAAGMLPQKLSGEEVIETAERMRVPFTDLVEGIVGRLPRT